MTLGLEIDYEALIDRTIRDFKPVKRLWSVRARLFCWILFDLAILAGIGALLGYHHILVRSGIAGLLHALSLPTFASAAAVFLALRGAVPGRDFSSAELGLLIAVVGGSVGISSTSFATGSGWIEGATSAAELTGVAVFPWSVLFGVVRRGVPLQPAKTGITIGLAAFSFALAVLRFINYESGCADQMSWLAGSGVLLTLFSALAGRLWLDWIVRWQRFPRSEDERVKTGWVNARILFPSAVAASLIVFVFVLRVMTAFVPIPDFDRTIETYERSLATGFRSNVPSGSIDMVATSYVEHGMPAYMWDFGPEGFRLIGGRWQTLPDGTPVTYTWFRGPVGAVICMMKQIDSFNPPPKVREKHQDLLFYEYRGFSICLINVGGYGNFLSVIAAPIPMSEFVALVLRAVD